MSKFTKPRLMWAYKCINEPVFIVSSSQKRVRGWMAEQGPSKRIMRVKLSTLRKK